MMQFCAETPPDTEPNTFIASTYQLKIPDLFSGNKEAANNFKTRNIARYWSCVPSAFLDQAIVFAEGGCEPPQS